MEYMFDTANIEVIKEYSKIFPITGSYKQSKYTKKRRKN